MWTPRILFFLFLAVNYFFALIDDKSSYISIDYVKLNYIKFTKKLSTETIKKIWKEKSSSFLRITPEPKIIKKKKLWPDLKTRHSELQFVFFLCCTTIFLGVIACWKSSKILEVFYIPEFLWLACLMLTIRKHKFWQLREYNIDDRVSINIGHP